jgi:choline transporter-like protein 2/4/5
MFFVFLIAFGFAGYYAHREGDLDKLLVPRDTNGYQCGQDSEVIDKPNLLFFDLSKCADPLVPIEGCPTPQICVKECPKNTFVHSKNLCNSEGVQSYRKKLFCTKEVADSDLGSCDSIDIRVQNKQCAEWYMKSEPCKFSSFP